ncbi:MAG: 3-hydroxybutyryl-CoA dehydrogenase, partial [Fimbriimonadaceae bacterium]|nr:3-hydroxybutyryl-CoA dehydrogenase [Fimbriimonadaceae bacterium]
MGVVGAGAMGAGIAQVAAAAGHQVLVFDSQISAAADAKVRLQQTLAKLIEKGKLTQVEGTALLERIRPVEQLSELAGCGLIVEAIIEDLAAKTALFVEIEKFVSSEAIVTTNTSSLSITALASALQRPQRFAGLHFFNPAPVMPLVEVVSGLAT